jgi:hypothetical protein
MDQEQPRPKPYKRPRAMLTKEDVAQIRAHLNEGTRLAILAMYFGVHIETITRIRDKKTWRHVAPAAKAALLSAF